MLPTGTQINYLHICHRKLWLFSHGVQMEHRSALVKAGKLLHETAYVQRAKKFKELDLGFIKIDHYDPHKQCIHEIKRSKKCTPADTAQVKYYLWVLSKCAISATAILEYPLLRKRSSVQLEQADHLTIQEWINQIQTIIKTPTCPAPIQKTICKSCSYAEFCYS